MDKKDDIIEKVKDYQALVKQSNFPTAFLHEVWLPCATRRIAAEERKIPSAAMWLWFPLLPWLWFSISMPTDLTRNV